MLCLVEEGVLRSTTITLKVADVFIYQLRFLFFLFAVLEDLSAIAEFNSELFFIIRTSQFSFLLHLPCIILKNLRSVPLSLFCYPVARKMIHLSWLDCKGTTSAIYTCTTAFVASSRRN